MTRALTLIAALLAASLAAMAESSQPRGYIDAPVGEEAPPPRLAPPDTTGGSERGFEQAPPTIPHSVDGHQTDLNANRCLTCHKRPGESGRGIPDISITHFYNRQGEATESVAGSRYLCLKCHVPRHRGRLPVGTDFRGSNH